MPVTTIKVPTEVRDRLAALAGRHHHTLGQEIAELVDHAEEDAWFDSIDAAYTDMTPEQLDDYRAEAHTLTAPPSEPGQNAAAEEFPEYDEPSR